MAPMTNADESPTNRLTLFPIYLSLFIVSTLWNLWYHSNTRVKQSMRIFFASLVWIEVNNMSIMLNKLSSLLTYNESLIQTVLGT